MTENYPDRLTLDVTLEDIDDAVKDAARRGFHYTTMCPLARAARRHFTAAWVSTRCVQSAMPISRAIVEYPLTPSARAFQRLFDSGGTVGPARFTLTRAGVCR